MLNIPTTFRIATLAIFLLPFFYSPLVKSQASQSNVSQPTSNDGVLTEDKVQKLFRQTQANKRNINLTLMKDSLEGRTKWMNFPTRFPLPDDWVDAKHQEAVECGGTYNVAKDGFVRFIIDSGDSPCHLGFLGSRAEHCQVAVMCDGLVHLSQDKDYCSGKPANYFKIVDGTTGASEYCGGEFNLSSPLMPSIGQDLFVEYKGVSLQSPCVAYCLEGSSQSESHPSPNTLGRSEFREFSPSGADGSCICGRINNVGRVVGGTDALKFEFPWLAALTFKGIPAFERVPFCDGVLISDSHVITAAHCFDVITSPEEFQVLLHAHVMDKTPNNGDFTEAEAAISPGWNLPKSTDQSENSVRLDIEEIVIHPFFDKYTFDYDVAILKLKTKVNLYKLSPICLPYMAELYLNSLEYDDNMIVAGWGTASETAKVSNRLLQKLDVPFVDHRRCLKYMPASKRHLCAGYLEGGRDSCTGDSGGPLIHNFNSTTNQFLLAGIVSSGSGCAQKSKLGLYTDLKQVLQWVYYHTLGAGVMVCNRH